MAGDWIKMRIGLADDPAVIAISRATKLDADTVVGKLHCIWGWADQNTADGRLDGVPASWIDTKVGKRGFAAAMASTNPPWLIIEDSGVTIPRFDRHNGKAAKSRADALERQRLTRKMCDKSVTDVTNFCDKSVTREEKRRVLTAPSDGDWTEARQKANELAKILGSCCRERDRRLLLGAAFLSQFHDNGAKWLEIAARETREVRPDKPYAFFQKVAYNQAETDGVDLSTSIGRLDIPAELLERRKQPC
jgi:hypothetical protein